MVKSTLILISIYRYQYETTDGLKWKIGDDVNNNRIHWSGRKAFQAHWNIKYVYLLYICRYMCLLVYICNVCTDRECT